MTKIPSCLLAIQHCYQDLTPAEKRIADYISANSSQIIHMSVQQLADNTGTAKSAVIRCCKSLGFSGYPELKISLSADISKHNQLNYLPYIHPGDDESTILDKIFAANVKALHDTAEQIDRTMLKALIDTIAAASHIYIYGIATSAAPANDFQYRLMQAGCRAQCFTDIGSMKVSTLNIRPGDVAIGISHSGRTRAIIEALQLAKEHGAATACITSYPHSPITQTCDFPLTVYSDEIDYPMEAISARIAQTSVIDAIAVSLSARDYDTAVERAKSTLSLLDTIRK